MASPRDKLQFISKAGGIDEDELPSDLETSDVYDRYQFLLSDAYDLCHIFENMFKIVGSEERVIRKLDSEVFQHNKWSVPFALKYKQLKRLLANRSRLTIIRDCANRLRLFSLFLDDVIDVCKQEIDSWRSICYNAIDTPPQSKLDCLNSICEDLRVHMNNFSSIVHSTNHSEAYLGRNIVEIASQLPIIESEIKRLRDKTLMWIEHFIKTGIKVLAHSDLERTSSDVLWNIARGIEEYNAIVQSINDCTYDPQPINFIDLLSSMAAEKAKYVALLSFRYISSSEEIQDVLKKQLTVSYNWNKAIKCKRKLNENDLIPFIDLTDRIWPVMDVYQHGWQVLSNLMSVFAHSTSLLRTSLRSSMNSSRRRKKRNVNRNKTEKSRKTVKWEDTDDYGIREKLMQHYSDCLWFHVGKLLTEYFEDMCWGNVEECDGQLGRISFLSNYTVLVLEKSLQYLCCIDDLFPIQGKKSLLLCAVKLHFKAALSASDSNICNAIGYSTVDKCLPVVLYDGLFCTNTTKLLTKSFEPLIHLLQFFQEIDQTENNLPCIWQELLPIQISCLNNCETLCNIAARWCESKTKQLLIEWNLRQFLLFCYSDLKVLCDEFTSLVSLSQPKHIDETVLLTNEDNSNYVLTEILHQRLSTLAISIQTLSSSITKEFSEAFKRKSFDFFEKNLPIGKTWKKKADSSLNEPSPYAEMVIEELIEPILSACNQLTSNSQMSVYCIALNAICFSWTSIILEKKIRFSIFGAMQLQQDFNYVKRFITEKISDESVKQSVLEMDVFTEFKSIIDLLLQQPRYGRTANRGRVHSTLCCDESAVSTVESTYASNGFGTARSSTTSSLPNANVWLSLRLQRGTRFFGLSSCFAAVNE